MDRNSLGQPFHLGRWPRFPVNLLQQESDVSSSKTIETQVLIAGGGPVGLTTAIELAHFGVQSILVERNATTTRHPKMDLTNGRAMELFRRTGLAEKIREVGVPRENNYDILWISNLKPGSHLLHKFGYDNADHEYWRRRTVNDGTLTLEEPLRVSQIVIEPVMREVAEASDLTDVRFGWALEEFEQDEDGVTATVRNVESGELQAIRAAYLIGCDGGNSTVRAKLGIENEGRRNVVNAYMIHIRSTAYDVLHHFGQAWHYQTNWGGMIAQNDVDEWTIHRFLAPGEDATSIDPRKVVEDAFGGPFDFEILVANPWSAHYLVAEQYSVGRVLMAGDACHQFMPTGGYGMNTGIAEVGNLTWKVAAAVHGWGSQALLDSYHTERRSIAKLSWQTSERHLGVRFKIGELYEKYNNIHTSTAESAEERARLAYEIAALGNGENEAWGTEHGYIYDGSPIVANEGTQAPAFDCFIYEPTTRPGARLPHVFLEDGRAVYDLLGKWFTVLVTDGADCSAFTRAAQEIGVPLEIVTIDDAKAATIYEQPIVLVRPDHHVAWRGDAVPGDAKAILQLALGNA